MGNVGCILVTLFLSKFCTFSHTFFGANLHFGFPDSGGGGTGINFILIFGLFPGGAELRVSQFSFLLVSAHFFIGGWVVKFVFGLDICRFFLQGRKVGRLQFHISRGVMIVL